MLTINIDIQDRLINGQTRIFRHIKFAYLVLKKYMERFLMNKLAQKQ